MIEEGALVFPFSVILMFPLICPFPIVTSNGSDFDEQVPAVAVTVNDVLLFRGEEVNELPVSPVFHV
jgi:hypothetical protein